MSNVERETNFTPVCDCDELSMKDEMFFFKIEWNIPSNMILYLTVVRVNLNFSTGPYLS